jgi:hypothetical protein
MLGLQEHIEKNSILIRGNICQREEFCPSENFAPRERFVVTLFAHHLMKRGLGVNAA